MERSKESDSLLTRFWLKVDVNSVNGCWLWTASVDTHGYGHMRIGSRSDGSRRMVTASRVSWEAHNGVIPDGICVCHTCDIRKCVNPKHLFLATHKENMLDMSTKGWRGYKLSASNVSEIRNLRGVLSQIDLAKKFDVSSSLISLIMNRKIWRSSGGAGLIQHE